MIITCWSRRYNITLHQIPLFGGEGQPETLTSEDPSGPMSTDKGTRWQREAPVVMHHVHRIANHERPSTASLRYRRTSGCYRLRCLPSLRIMQMDLGVLDSHRSV